MTAPYPVYVRAERNGWLIDGNVLISPEGREQVWDDYRLPLEWWSLNSGNEEERREFDKTIRRCKSTAERCAVVEGQIERALRAANSHTDSEATS